MTRAAVPKPPDYAAKRACYDRIVQSVPGLQRKGAANPYTAINGNMSSYLHPSGQMALRLPPGLRETFCEEHGTHLFEAYGIVQKEYVAVPAKLLEDTEGLRPYFEASHVYVAGLKPKPTRTRKSA